MSKSIRIKLNIKKIELIIKKIKITIKINIQIIKIINTINNIKINIIIKITIIKTIKINTIITIDTRLHRTTKNHNSIKKLITNKTFRCLNLEGKRKFR